jgi:hypothetical protein
LNTNLFFQKVNLKGEEKKRKSFVGMTTKTWLSKNPAHPFQSIFLFESTKNKNNFDPIMALCFILLRTFVALYFMFYLSVQPIFKIVLADVCELWK